MKKTLSSLYFDDTEAIKAILKDLVEDFSQFENDQFCHHLSYPFFQKALKQLASQKTFNFLEAYWIKSLDHYLYLLEMHEILNQTETDLPETELPSEEDLFDYWNESHLCEAFQEFQAENLSIIETSLKLRVLQEENLLSFLILQLNQKVYGQDKEHTPLSYRLMEELGDNSNSINLGPQFINFQTTSKISNYPFITIEHFNPRDQIITLTEKEHSFSIKGKEPYEISLNKDHFLKIQTSTLPNESQWPNQVNNALLLISKVSPRCYRAFIDHTHCLIPHTQNGIVSYSFQEFSGVSFLNTIERDFVDLLDDLIHENGHHILNKHLNSYELILETDEKIFYSPWREELRPIRGLYHAYLTFSWALFLFSDLARYLLNEPENSELTKVQEKIFLRLQEEAIMLKACDKQIVWAYQKSLITKEGFELYQAFKSLIDCEDEIITDVQARLQADYPNTQASIKEMTKKVKEKTDELAYHLRA